MRKKLSCSQLFSLRNFFPRTVCELSLRMPVAYFARTFSHFAEFFSHWKLTLTDLSYRRTCVICRFLKFDVILNGNMIDEICVLRTDFLLRRTSLKCIKAVQSTAKTYGLTAVADPDQVYQGLSTGQIFNLI